MEVSVNGQVKLKPKNGKRNQEWLIKSNGIIQNSEFSLILDAERLELGGKLIGKKRKENIQYFTIEVFRMEDNEYNKLIFY